MRFVSPIALGLMLAIAGAGTVAATPAFAAKEKSGGAPKLKLSPEFIPAIQKASEAVTKKDVEGANAALAAAEPLAKTNDDKYQFYAIMLNLSITANDAAMQGKALSGMLDTGLVPADQQGQFLTIAANNDLSAKNYDKALERAGKAQQLGYKPGQVNPILAQAYWGKAGTSNLSAEPQRTLVKQGLDAFRSGIAAMKAAGEAVPAQWYLVATGKAEAAGLPEIADWAQMGFEADPSGQNLRTVLRVFQRQNPGMTNRENLDLMRLMNVSGGLALRPDYVEYAEMAFKGGIFGEVKSSIDAGRAKGVLTPSDGSDYYTVASGRIAGDKGSLAAAEADSNKAATGKIAASTADAYMGYGDYAKAANLFRLALQKGSVDAAEVNTRLGIALAMANDVAGAKEAFAKVSGGTRGSIARYWLLWLEKKAA